jgi:hypothetical protein
VFPRLDLQSEKHPGVLTPAKAGRLLCVTRSGT